MPGLTIFNEEQAHRLALLKEEIQQGIDSGPSKPFDMKAIITKATMSHLMHQPTIRCAEGGLV